MGETIEKRGLIQRLNEGAVICAEGYLFEMERRGYIQAGAFVPEVVLNNPEVVEQLHREFLRAGTDVVEAFTYYGHREKLRVIGKEDLLEPLHKNALAIAKKVANETTGEPLLVAGNICNTNIWTANEKDEAEVRKMFDEQVAWAAEAGVDFIIGETFSEIGEAVLALESINKVRMPSVITMAVHQEEIFKDGLSIEDGLKKLEDAGATVVGLNCARGPQTILPLIQRVRNVVNCHVAALPVPYRTTAEEPTFQSLRDPHCHSIPEDRPFPTALDPFTCNRYEIADFAKQMFEMNVRYIGVCCGGAPHHVRSIAEALGRNPEASEYSADMSKHFAFGKNARDSNREFKNKL